jgi:CubicO group peptidase (beta-lactamase class C family)
MPPRPPSGSLATGAMNATLRECITMKLLGMATLVVVASGASFSPTQQQGAQPPTGLGGRIHSCLQQTTPSTGFSGTVLVANKGVVELQHAYGPGVTADTKFYIASISKQFTAAAILRLQEKGRLCVHDEITRFLQGVPADKTHITLHQLLTHTSGLPHKYAADGVTERAQAIRAILALPLRSAPGEAFGYSNDGYTLLAAIVEIAAGEPFEQFMRRELLAPAQLVDTGFWGDPIRTGSPIAPTMSPVDTKPSWGFRGATGMYSAVSDLYRWVRALLDHRILRKESVDQMMRAYTTTSRGAYGYGWFTSKTRQGIPKSWTAGYEDFGHSGLINVYESGAVSVILTNGADVDGEHAREAPSRQIESALFDDEPRCELSALARPLTSGEGLVAHGVRLEAATYRGRKAVHVVNAPGGGDALAILPDVVLEEGMIEVDVAGQPEVNAPPAARGFIGLAFRISPDASQYECIYIRPTNGRADDQLRRNHTTQYISAPDFLFDRLRREAPGVYESYVDLVAGEWTNLRIAVAGQSARMFLNRVEQPSLIINDLKHPARAGPIGLWIGDWTDGYFSELKVSRFR